MKQYLADLHIHTCLSPCGSLEMSPSEIVRRSLAKGLDAIAITDHNTTLQCPEIQSLGERFGLRVFGVTPRQVTLVLLVPVNYCSCKQIHPIYNLAAKIIHLSGLWLDTDGFKKERS